MLGKKYESRKGGGGGDMNSTFNIHPCINHNIYYIFQNQGKRKIEIPSNDYLGSGVGQPDLNQYLPFPCLLVSATNESSFNKIFDFFHNIKDLRNSLSKKKKSYPTWTCNLDIWVIYLYTSYYNNKLKLRVFFSSG